MLRSTHVDNEWEQIASGQPRQQGAVTAAWLSPELWRVLGGVGAVPGSRGSSQPCGVWD